MRRLARRLHQMQLHNDVGGDDGNRCLKQQLDAAGNAVGRALGDFQIIVGEAEQAERNGHAQHRPHIHVGEIGP